MAELTDKEVATRFTYHPPNASQLPRYQLLRRSGLELASIINRLCPSSRETALAFTRLEEAIMWANAAIARRES